MKTVAVLALALAYVAALAIAADPPTDAGADHEAAPMKDDGEGTEAATTEAMGRDQGLRTSSEMDIAHAGAANKEALEFGWGGNRGYNWGGGGHNWGWGRGYGGGGYGGGGYGGGGYGGGGYGGGGFRHNWRS